MIVYLDALCLAKTYAIVADAMTYPGSRDLQTHQRADFLDGVFFGRETVRLCVCCVRARTHNTHAHCVCVSACVFVLAIRSTQLKLRFFLKNN